jgi:hypothetical protein
VRNHTWQSEAGCEPTDRDRYDYHKVTPYACGFRRSLLCGVGASIIVISKGIVKLRESEAGCESEDCDRYD